MAGEQAKKAYLAPGEVARLLMVSPATVRQWAQKGDLPALATPGGHRRFQLVDVERFAQQRGLALHTPQRSAEIQGLRVLVVDDEPQIARYLSDLITSRINTAQVEAAENGFVAGLKVRSFQPDVVLLDLMMPGMDGFQVCRLLKAEVSTRQIRVVVITGYPSPENISRAREAGADACLAKPIPVQSLLDELALAREGAGRQQEEQNTLSRVRNA